MKNIIQNLLKLSLVFAICAPLHAAAPAAKPTPTLKTKPDTISTASTDSITVTHEKIKYSGKTAAVVSASLTYKITKSTSITVNGNPGKAEDLKAGMLVSVTADPADDKSIAGIASVITAHDATAAAASAAKAGKGKDK